MSLSTLTAPAPAVGISDRLPGLLVGPGLVALGGWIFMKVGPPPGTFAYIGSLALVAFGLLWSGLSLCLPAGRLWRFIRWLSINLLVLGALLGMVEGIGRVAKINFAAIGPGAGKDSRQAYPIWAREPDRPLPEVFFLHPGPVRWTGRPLHELERLRQGTDNAYASEPVVTIDYDTNGFRNPPDLKDWDAVVVGDSYVELGYLPFEQTSSAIAAARTGLRIKGLGACATGLLTYSRYLRHFGAAPSCKRVVYVMFEGNDVQDTTREHQALEQYQRTGERPYKEAGVETSFVKAVAARFQCFGKAPRPQSYQNAWFKSGNAEIPVTVSTELPVDPRAMTPAQAAAMKAGITALAAEARALHLEVSLVYVPFNNRVYHDLLRFDDKLPAEVRQWRPDGLPAWVADLCREQGIVFHNALPPLRAAAEKGRYVHNRIFDCHLNAEGAAILGDVITDALKPGR